MEKRNVFSIILWFSFALRIHPCWLEINATFGTPDASLMQPEQTGNESWKLIGLIQKRQLMNGNLEGVEAEIVNALTKTGQQSELHDTSEDIAIDEHKSLQKWSVFGFITLGIIALMAALQLSEVAKSHNALIAISMLVCSGLAACFFIPNFKNNSSQVTQSSRELREEIETLQDQNWELKEHEHRHRTLVEAFGDMIMDRYADGTITFANPAFCRFLGVSEAELVGQNFSSVLSRIQDDAPKFKPGEIKEVSLAIDGKTKWMAWLDLPIRGENSAASGLRTVARDITDQKVVELELRAAHSKAETASEAKTRFLANVSHEMRTPLNGILGMSGLLVDTRLTPEQVTYVNAVHDSGLALLTLIEDILDMTLVEAGKLEFRTLKISPHRLVEDVCELLASRAHGKNIAIASHVAFDVPAQIETDAGRLRQVLINLIGNAIKFTENGGVFISLKRGGNDSSSVKLDFAITDTGPGITQKDQNIIFEEFSQADSKSTREHGGAGLGLTISRRIIEQMGGKISVESSLDKGSVFSFHILARDMSSDVVHRPVQSTHLYVATLTGERMTQTAINCYLEDQGISTSSFQTLNDTTPPEAGKPDVVLVDSTCLSEGAPLGPAISDVTRKIVLLNPEERPNLNALLALGFDGYLIKPIRKSSLMGMIFDRETRPDGREISNAEKWSSSDASTEQVKSILLAEDNDINALLARTVLEKAGHQVTRAANGAEAIALLKERHLAEEPFDLILLDLQMPVMDGLEALQEIRSREKNDGRPHLPVFVLTADEQEDTRAKAISTGADGFLTKPLKPAELLKTVNVMEVSPELCN